jgi:NitT/TauT family transport system substrate-binding protein
MNPDGSGSGRLGVGDCSRGAVLGKHHAATADASGAESHGRAGDKRTHVGTCRDRDSVTKTVNEASTPATRSRQRYIRGMSRAGTSKAAAVFAVLAAVVAAVASAAVANKAAPTVSGDQGPPVKLEIAYQPGIGYAPLIVIKKLRLIEKQFPGTKVNWKVLASGAAITDGVVAGKIDVGAGGVGPLLIGWAKGVNWKFIAPMNQADLWLMAKDPKIRTIADLRGKRVAMPSPSSIQGIVLRKMAQAKLGDAHALDSTIVSMDHPAAMQALLSGQIDAHFTSPPFQYQELAQGAHIVGHSKGYFGAHTFLGVLITQKFYDEHTAFAKRLYKDVQSAIKLIKNQPRQVGKILSDDAGGQPSAATFKRWLTNKAMSFSTRPRGLLRFSTFMNKIALINKTPSSWKDLVFPPVYPTKGS